MVDLIIRHRIIGATHETSALALALGTNKLIEVRNAVVAATPGRDICALIFVIRGLLKIGVVLV